MIQGYLKAAVALGTLRPLDEQFARRIAAIAGEDGDELQLAAALVSRRVGDGDVCVDLGDCADDPLFAPPADPHGPAPRLEPPDPEHWVSALRGSAAVGAPGERAPLILDDQRRLYLARYWRFERTLADALARRTGTWAGDLDAGRLRAGLDRLFPAREVVDWQRVAAALALLRPFCVITGGPGTGKTRTVTSILALLLDQAGEGSGRAAPRIALAAPTGKAAARLTESIRGAKAALALDPAIADAIPDAAATLHRLLGFRPDRANPRHGPDDPLHLDILVVDEASMLDLPLMARLLDALPAHARLILLGDKDQLASVEAGMVLGDICGRGAPVRYSTALRERLRAVAGVDLFPDGGRTAPIAPPIADHIVVLRESWRFRSQSGIGALAGAVNEGDGARALAVLSDPGFADVVLQAPSAETLDRLIAAELVPTWRRVLSAGDPAAALAALEHVRVLCAVRKGPLGVHSINRRAERALEQAGLIRCSGEVYAGRPVIVTANDHAQRLYNGDVGLILPDPDSGGALRVFFESAAGMRRILPSRLPPHETVYAMTVHKSQGSEVDRVILVLPEGESRLVTRELVYTGVTRARESVALLADAQTLEQSVASRVVRMSGLYDACWGVADGGLAAEPAGPEA